MTDFITRKEVARILNISESTVYRWALSGHLIPPFELGPNRVVWCKHEIFEWIKKQKLKHRIK
jgi:predicted DNA-binding transcriptional regulator AlpA